MVEKEKKGGGGGARWCGGGRRNFIKRMKRIYDGVMVRRGDEVFYLDNNFKQRVFYSFLLVSLF